MENQQDKINIDYIIELNIIKNEILNYYRTIDEINSIKFDEYTIEIELTNRKAELNKYWFDELASNRVNQEIKEFENKRNNLIKEALLKFKENVYALKNKYGGKFKVEYSGSKNLNYIIFHRLNCNEINFKNKSNSKFLITDTYDDLTSKDIRKKIHEEIITDNQNCPKCLPEIDLDFSIDFLNKNEQALLSSSNIYEDLYNLK